MKSFSKSTILGLTFGVLIAGYAVFAYTPPTVAPPGGNVSAPLNVGSGAQVKSGGLWVNSLGVDGGVQIGGRIDASGNICTVGGKCLEELSGRVSILEGQVIGTDTDKDGIADPSDCAPSDNTRWQNLGCYIDNDGDGVRSSYTSTVCSGLSCSGSTGSPGTDCAATDSTKWQLLTGYADSDGDTRTLPGTSVCSGASLPSSYLPIASSLDCDDTCATCYPGSTSYTASPDGKDQDCDGVIDQKISNSTNNCSAAPRCSDLAYGSYIAKGSLASACNAHCGPAGGTATCVNAEQPWSPKCTSINFSNCALSGFAPSGDVACEPAYGPILCTCNPAYR